MKNLNNLFRECQVELDSLHIPYSPYIVIKPNYRAKHRWGQCKKLMLDTYEINISADLLADNVDDKATKTTIIHEMLHTVPGGNCHTGKWKQYANYVNSKLGYNITRTTSAAEKGLDERPIRAAKYIITCDKCGYKWYRTRATQVTNNPGHYHCKCGGNLQVTEV